VDAATFIYAISNKREDMTLGIGIMGLGRCNVDTTSSKLLYWPTRPKLLPTPNPHPQPQNTLVYISIGSKRIF